MTVGELIKELAKYPRDNLVDVTSDLSPNFYEIVSVERSADDEITIVHVGRGIGE